jgi:hypothetical protein
MAYFWKKLRPKKIFAGFLIGSILIIFLVWISLPFLLKWGLSGIARDSGFSEFEVEIEQVDPWLTRLSKIEMHKKDQMSLAIDQVNLIYSPGTLAQGAVNSISMTGLDLMFQADGESFDGRSETKKPEPLEEIMSQFLEAPYLTHLRIRDSKLNLTWDGQSYPVDFLLKGDFHHQIGRLIVDGSLSGFQFQSKVDLAKDEEKTYLTGEVKFADLTKFSQMLESTHSLGQLIPKDLALMDGELELLATARVEADSFKDLFLELNASDLKLEASGHDLNVSDAVLFLSPETMDNWQANFYANMEVDNQLNAKGIRLSVKATGPVYELSGGVSQLRTAGDLPLVEITGLRLPILDLSLPLEIPVGQEKKIFFDEVSYDNGSLILMDGSLSVEVLEVLGENSLVSVHLSPGDASFGEIGFVGFSYGGLLDWEDFPKVSRQQIVSGDRIMLDLDSVVENLNLAFRMESLEQILVDQFTFDASGVAYDLNPANLLVKVSQETPEAPVFVFRGSTFRFPDQDILIEGIEGEISLASIEPLATKGSQTIFFERIVMGELETGEGNFSFRAEPDGTIVIESARAALWGGEVGLRESSFHLYGDDYRLNTRVAGIDGQRVADLLAKEDLRIDGNFSGDITFSNEEGKWDFSNGLVLLDPSPTAWMSYNPGSVVLSSLKKGSKEYKKMKMTNEAMEGLSLKSMRILFKALDGKREVEIAIRGKSEGGNRIIHLDNNLNFIAGIRELVGAYFDFSNLGIDLSNFGIDLKHFDIE